MAPTERLFKHTCTIRALSAGTASSAQYGHGATTAAAYETGVRCLLQSATLYGNRGAERGSRLSEMANLGEFFLYIPYRSWLLADGAEGLYDITAVKDEAGNVLHAGPLNIRFVNNSGGQQNHLELVLDEQPVGT